MENRHVSRYYVKRKGQKRHARYSYPKLTVVCDTDTHLWLSAIASKGPTNDHIQFSDAMIQASENIQFDRLLADAGYDSQENHRLCREELGIRSTVINLNKRRNPRKWPTTKYRRQMRKKFHKNIYGNRWQVESSFSTHKRLLGAALRSTSENGRNQELLFRAITHNLMAVSLQ